MTRGDYEFQQYYQALKDAVILGMALTDEEQDILDQGIKVGAVSTPMPKVEVWCEGIKLYDPRTVSHVKSNNPALILRDLLKRTGKLDCLPEDVVCDMADAFDEAGVGLDGVMAPLRV